MRTVALALAVVGWTLSALAAKPVNVAALEQILTEQEAGHKSDSAIAQELSDLELTEELTAPTLQHIKATVQPGPQTAQALELLADASALLSPLASEIPAAARPDMEAQRAMYTAAVNYVVTTLRHLPDFLATRETRSFNDSPAVVSHSGYAPVTAMHAVGTFQREITYRDGKEALEAEEAAAKKTSEPVGLTTWGEFGPVLAIILTDSLKGRVTWSHWENEANGRVGVFHYEVPKAASHYQVDFCCAWKELSDVEPSRDPKSESMAYHGTPAYHGELYLDPASGAIERVTLEAELGETEVIREAAISVEYGPVEIGGTTYICPTRSVAISQDMNRPGITIGGALPVTRINETLFTGYHRFGSTVRILAGTPENVPPVGVESATPPQTAQNAAQTASTAPETTSAESGAPAAAATEPSASAATAGTEANATTAPAENAGRAFAQPASQTATATNAVAAESAPANEPEEKSAQAPPVFKTTARDVVLDVVVTKGNGDAVTGLGKQDFAVTEDGRAQTLDFFEGHTANEATTNVPEEMPALPAGAVTNVPPAAEGDAVNVLLLDSLNTPAQDQANVRGEIQGFLKKMKPGTRMAVFTLGTKLRFVQGFTTDSSVLLAALKQGEEGERHGRSRSDAASDASDIAELQAMRASGFATETMQAEQAQATAEDQAARANMTFQALTYLAHYLSGVPGRKNLLWCASSFPVVIFPTQEETKSIERNPGMHGYMERVKETGDLFTSAQISIYPIGAGGMMTEHLMDADMEGPGAPKLAPGQRSSNAPEGPLTNGTMSPFVAGAGERAQVVNEMEQLAASTGGKAFYNTNDLNGAMVKAIDDGANYYTIGYSPTDKTRDGSFRQIDVKVTHGKYKLAYRHGYNAEEAPAADVRGGANPLTELLGYGLPGATGVLYGVDAKAGPTEEASASNRAGANTALQGPVTRYRVDFTIRTGDVELRPNAQGGRSGRLLIGLKAYDRDGNVVNWEGDGETLDVKDSDYAALVKSGIPAHLMIDVPAGAQAHLVTAVYDWNSGRAGTLEVPLGGSKPRVNQ